MNQFNSKLDQARIRQKNRYLISAISLVTVFVLIALGFSVSRGTRIEITPEEAKTSAQIRLTRGLGLFFQGSVYSLSTTPQITAEAKGFAPATETIPAASLGKTFTLALRPLPGQLTLRITPQVIAQQTAHAIAEQQKLSKTRWSINGRYVALGPELDLELAAGQYKILVDNPYSLPLELETEIRRAEQTSQQIELTAVDGRIEISSEPSGATVSIDGEKIGQTPLALNQPGGLYNIAVGTEHYIESTEQLQVTRNEPQLKRNYRLKRQQVEVSLDLSPEGGTVLVNGIKAGTPLLLGEAETYRLSYIKPGYYSDSKTITPLTGKSNRLSFTLKAETGRVEISASPWAHVFIGSRDYGKTPVTLDLAAVPQTITLKRAGYRPVSRSITPSGKSVKTISVQLTSEKQARLAEAPREFTNSAGIKLKLFMVKDSFTMGAARSEKGQRANEFQRKIVLNRPFYASIYEITNGQYGQFDKQKASAPASLPVTSVNWHQAARFCNWLSSRENLPPFYRIDGGSVRGFSAQADGYRLLSEAEWEWLARKAGKSQQTTFSWGNQTVIPPKSGNVADESAKGKVRYYVPGYTDGFAGIAPVGSFSQEPSGLYDMAGNVSEWVHDSYSIIPPEPEKTERNPLGLQSGESQLMKGANFRSGTITTLRPAYRQGLNTGRDDLGFRVGRYLYGGDDG
jgi:formylglycine-generating enzyme required for sulfatase activity